MGGRPANLASPRSPAPGTSDASLCVTERVAPGEYNGVALSLEGRFTHHFQLTPTGSADV